MAWLRRASCPLLSVVVLLLVCFLAPRAAARDPSSSCYLEHGTDYYGGDLQKENTKTPAACCALCQNTAGCKFFSFALNEGLCYLKSQLINRVPNDDRVSGSMTPPPPSPHFPWENVSLPLAERVLDIVQRLTLEEKVAQLQAGSPSVPTINLPGYSYGHECERGDVTSAHGTAFPQSLGLAGSFDMDLVHRVGRATANEVRANFNIGETNGLNCWSPVVNICRDPRWGRCQETYGEDPVLSAAMAFAYVQGLQNGSGVVNPELVSTCKHYDVHGGPEGNGQQVRFGTKVTVTPRDWHQTFLPAFDGCMEAGAGGVMCSYSAVRFEENATAIPSCANAVMIDHLRLRMQMKGYVVSDCGALKFIFSEQHYVTSELDAAVAAINAGTDMECDCCGFGPVFPHLTEAVEQGLVDESRVDEALTRVLSSRMLLGALDPRGDSPYSNISGDEVESPAHLALAREAAEKTLVLLQNENGVLPLPSTTSDSSSSLHVCVFGPNANCTNCLLGDYAPHPSYVVTILEGIQQRAPPGTRIDYMPGCDSNACNTLINISGVIDLAGTCDVNLAVIGLTAENACGACQAGKSWVEGECCDRYDVQLPGQQLNLLQYIEKARPGHTVVLSINGGMVDLSWAKANVAGIFQWVYPSQEAGHAFAAALYGDVNPAGRLSLTYYADPSATLPDIGNYTMVNRTYRYFDGNVTFGFGFGLSYTTFQYTELEVPAQSVKPCDAFVINVTVTNTGSRSGSEVVQLYTTTQNASVPLPLAQLWAFERIYDLQPGASQVVSLTITPKALAVYRDGDFIQVIEPGVRRVWVGGAQEGQGVGLAGKFSVAGDVTPLALCGEAAGYLAKGRM